MFKRNGMVKRLRSHSSSVKASRKAQARNHPHSRELREHIFVFWSRVASSRWRAAPCGSTSTPSEVPSEFASHDSGLGKRTQRHPRRVRCPSRMREQSFPISKGPPSLGNNCPSLEVLNVRLISV